MLRLFNVTGSLKTWIVQVYYIPYECYHHHVYMFMCLASYLWRPFTFSTAYNIRINIHINLVSTCNQVKNLRTWDTWIGTVQNLYSTPQVFFFSKVNWKPTTEALLRQTCCKYIVYKHLYRQMEHRVWFSSHAEPIMWVRVLVDSKTDMFTLVVG